MLTHTLQKGAELRMLERFHAPELLELIKSHREHFAACLVWGRTLHTVDDARALIGPMSNGQQVRVVLSHFVDVLWGNLLKLGYMQPSLFYLVGPPGSGKRTLGLELARRTGAALLDNHLVNDVIFKAYGVTDGSQVEEHLWTPIGRVREIVREVAKAAPPGVSHIFTNYLSSFEHEWQMVAGFRTLAQERGVRFAPVWLTCPLEELVRRMPLPERRERIKLTDPQELQRLMRDAGNLPPPPDALVLDTSVLSPPESVDRILKHLEI